MKTFIDVGCALGTYAKNWLKVPDVRVFAFEPLMEWYMELRKLEAEEPRFQVFPFAICDKNRVAWFNVAEPKVCSSLKEMAPQGSKWYMLVDKVTVPCWRLDTFCTEYKVDSIQYLKIDAQGSDLDVLKGLGDMIHRTDEVLVEAFLDGFEDIYVGQQKVQDVLTFMQGNGFRFTAQRDDGNYTDLHFKRDQ